MDCCKAKEFGAGIVLYFMLSKSTPFLAPTPQKTIEKTMEGKAFDGFCGVWHEFGTDCISPVKKSVPLGRYLDSS